MYYREPCAITPQPRIVADQYGTDMHVKYWHRSTPGDQVKRVSHN